MKTLILDFDGTIADTRTGIVQTVQMTAKALKMPEPEEQEIIKLIGLPLKDTFIQALHLSDDKILDQAIAFYRDKYNDNIDTVQLFPNVAKTLEFIYKQEVNITIASNKGKNGLMLLLNKLGIIQYFSLILGVQDVQNKKPAPDMILRILDETKSLPKETLVVGDTIYDIEMGQQANCVTCGVTYGNHSENQLKAQKANYIIDDFIKIIDILKKI